MVSQIRSDIIKHDDDDDDDDDNDDDDEDDDDDDDDDDDKTVFTLIFLTNCIIYKRIRK